MGPGIGLLYGSRTARSRRAGELRSSGRRERIVSIAAMRAASLTCPSHPPNLGSAASPAERLA